MMQWLSEIFSTEAVSRLLFAVILLVIGIFAIRITLRLIRRGLGKTNLEKAAYTLIVSLCAAVLYVLLGLSVASAVGIDVTGVVALASVLTLSVSLALQNMLANVIGGFTLLYTQPFRSGDFVQIAGHSGTVQEIGMSYTVLCTAEGARISLPNSAVVAAQIVNYTAEGTRRVTVDVSASYDTPTQQVIDALVLAGAVDNVLLDPAPQAVLTAYGDSAISYSLRVWVKAADYWQVQYAVNQRVKEVFDQQGICMTYPHLNVHLEQR